MNSRIIYLKICFFAFLFSSCGDNDFDNTDAIEGEGPIVSEIIPVSDFIGVDLLGSFDVDIVQGSEQIVTAEGQANIIDRLKLEVNDDILSVTLEDGSYQNFDLMIFIQSPMIETYQLTGSGDMTIDGYENLENLNILLLGSGNIIGGNSFLVENSASLNLTGSGSIFLEIETLETIGSDILGSGDINLSGQTLSQTVAIIGSGNYNAFDLISDSAEITIVGSGDVQVTVNNTLTGELSGSGSIFYKGDPTIDVSVLAEGNVVNAN